MLTEQDDSADEDSDDLLLNDDDLYEDEAADLFDEFDEGVFDVNETASSDDPVGHGRLDTDGLYNGGDVDDDDDEEEDDRFRASSKPSREFSFLDDDDVEGDLSCETEEEEENTINQVFAL